MKPSHRMLVALLSDVIVAMNGFNVNLRLVSRTFCRILLSRIFSVGYMPLKCTTLRAFAFNFPSQLPDVQLRSYSFTACEHRNTAHPVDVPLKNAAKFATVGSQSITSAFRNSRALSQSSDSFLYPYPYPCPNPVIFMLQATGPKACFIPTKQVRNDWLLTKKKKKKMMMTRHAS